MRDYSKEFSPQKLKRVGIGMLILGVVVLMGLLRDIGSWKMFYPNAITVEAVVTGNDESYNIRGHSYMHGKKNNSYSYFPYVRYEVDGREYEIKLNRDTLGNPHHEPFPVGSTISFSVDGRHPTKALKSPDMHTYMFGSLVFFQMVFGVIFIYGADHPQIYAVKKTGYGNF